MPWLYHQLKPYYTVKPPFLFLSFPCFLCFLMHLIISLRSYPSQTIFIMFRKVLFRVLKKGGFNYTDKQWIFDIFLY